MSFAEYMLLRRLRRKNLPIKSPFVSKSNPRSLIRRNRIETLIMHGGSSPKVSSPHHENTAGHGVYFITTCGDDYSFHLNASYRADALFFYIPFFASQLLGSNTICHKRRCLRHSSRMSDCQARVKRSLCWEIEVMPVKSMANLYTTTSSWVGLLPNKRSDLN